MPKLMIILCQIIDQSLLATLNIHMAPYAGVILKQHQFYNGDNLAVLYQSRDAICDQIFEFRKTKIR
jgi:hypothetical protein